jgi:thiosulfate reductase cytochrome b subunit
MTHAAWLDSIEGGDRSLSATARVRMLASWAHRGANVSIVLGVPVQFYLAGALLFGVASIMPHRAGGFLLLLLSLLSLVFALVAGRGRGERALAGVLLGLMALQPVLVALKLTAPTLAALHAVNGLAILAVALLIESRLRK